MSIQALYPEGAVAFDAPVHKVTLLEDRAQVQRAGKVTLKAGQNRLFVKDVAPVTPVTWFVPDTWPQLPCPTMHTVALVTFNKSSS